MDRLGGQVRNTSGRFGRFRSIGVGAMTAVGGAALATTAVVVGIGAAVGDVTQRFLNGCRSSPGAPTLTPWNS